MIRLKKIFLRGLKSNKLKWEKNMNTEEGEREKEKKKMWSRVDDDRIVILYIIYAIS